MPDEQFHFTFSPLSLSQMAQPHIFHRPSQLPHTFWQLGSGRHATNANVILPIGRKLLEDERAGKDIGQNLWIITSSTQGIEFILSCTRGYMGKYPIFIFSTLPFNQLSTHYAQKSVEDLADTLHKTVSMKRVYSVFAPRPITKHFAQAWTAMTGIKAEETPYYDAQISYCTRESFVNRQNRRMTDPRIIYRVDIGVEVDVEQIAQLCFGFAKESEPFILTEEAAREEARKLVQAGQVWVLRAQGPGRPAPEIASIVCCTRNTESAATITKVYTSPNWRNKGCARRLVWEVCRCLLQFHNKEKVVLYVAHNNPAAANVYHKVGFLGISRDSKPVEGVDPWLEIGFDRRVVELGHW